MDDPPWQPAPPQPAPDEGCEYEYDSDDADWPADVPWDDDWNEDDEKGLT